MSKIEVCKRCTQRVFNRDLGLVCGLTNAKPTFEEACNDFAQDESVPEEEKKTLKPNARRASNAILMVSLVMFFMVISLVSDIVEYWLLKTISEGNQVDADVATSSDTRQLVISYLHLIVYVISVVTFIQWFRRAYFNLGQRIGTLTFDESWAAKSWFIPIVNLYKPYQIMMELYKETKELLLKEGRHEGEKLHLNYVGLWWSLWVIAGIVGRIIYQYNKEAETLDELMISSAISICSVVIDIPLSLVTIKVIKDYSQVEKMLDKE